MDEVGSIQVLAGGGYNAVNHYYNKLLDFSHCYRFGFQISLTNSRNN